MSDVRKRLYQHNDRLIELIYQSGVSPVEWQTLLFKLVELIDGLSGRLMFMDSSAKSIYASHMVNMDEGYYRKYVDYYINLCPWRPEFQSKPAGRLYSTYLDFSREHSYYYRSEFYSDWARPQGIAHGIGGNVVATSDSVVQLLLQRGAAPGHFTREETAAVNRLLVHIQRSLALQRQLEEKQREKDALVDAKQRSYLPGILLNERLEVVYVDDGVLSLLASYRVLHISSGKVSLRNERKNGHLQRLLRGCAAAKQGQWSHAGGCVRLQDAGVPLEIQVYPIHPAHEGFFRDGCYYVALYLNELVTRYTLNAPLVCDSFGLSPTELRLAVAICNGQTVEEFSRQNGTTQNTVRSQLKKLFAKTGVSRQAELPIRLLPYMLWK